MIKLSDKALLMIIDLQYAIDDISWGKRNNLSAESQVRILLSNWRQLAMPVLHVKHMSTNLDSAYRPNQKGNDFKELCAPIQGEDVLEKTTNSAFIGTNLESRLRNNNISEIVIVGVITNNSVEATARMSGNLGFKTIVVSDATFTFGRKGYHGQYYSAETIHDISLANLDKEYAHIMKVDEVLDLIDL